MSEPLLTVVIPTLGRRDTLYRAINSVLRQTAPTELIVEYDPECTGCGPTINRALNKVHTEWMAVMGDDDVLHPEFTECLEACCELYDMVIFQMQYPDRKILPIVRHPDQLRHGNVGTSYAVKHSTAQTIGYLNKPCAPGLGEDWEMISAVRSLGYRILLYPKVLYFIRHDPFTYLRDVLDAEQVQQ